MAHIKCCVFKFHTIFSSFIHVCSAKALHILARLQLLIARKLLVSGSLEGFIPFRNGAIVLIILSAVTMPSFRSRPIRLYMKRTVSKCSNFNLPKLREFRDSSGVRIKLAKRVTRVQLSIDDRPAEWLMPRNELASSVILYLHGGGYVLGSLESHRGLASHIAMASHVRVLLIDYRLAPETPLPAALDDALSAFDWLINNQGIESNKIIGMGDSAGGGLAIATVIHLRNANKPLPKALICLSPWTDLSLSGATISSMAGKDPCFPDARMLQDWANAYAGTEPLASPEISPLFADLRGLLFTFIQVGEEELLRSDFEEFFQAARRSDVSVELSVWSGMWHVWQAFCDFMPESRSAIKQIGSKVKHLFSSELKNGS